MFTYEKSMRFDEFLRSFDGDGHLIEIPGTDIYEYLLDFCSHDEAKNNYSLCQQWSGQYGMSSPKFVFVAYSMILFKCFNMLKLINPDDKKFDILLNGLWAFYLGIARKTLP